jgi:DNA-directed RNA polymerase II subunit RPB1
MGAGRIEEIINYSKDIKTPLMEIYLQPEHRGDKTTASRIAAALKYVTIGNLVKGAQIYYHQSKDGSDIDKIISQDQTGNPFFINNQKADLDSLPWVFRIELDREKMMEKDVSLLDIKAKFTAYWYQLANNTKTMGKVEKDLYSFLSRGAILSNFDTSSKPTIHIRVSLTQFNNQILNNFLKFVLNQITLKGINGIGAVEYDQQRLVNYDEDTGDQKIEQEYFIATNGINPIDIKKMKGIDHSRTYFNDIDTVYRLYGVEAARRIITTELQRVFSAGGAADLNFAHLSLLSDFMTHTGEIIPIDRHGSNKLDTDPISRASFEKTMEHFVNAALFNETDQVRSTSARVALGRVIQGGTGCFDLVLDTGKLENSEYLEDELKGVSKAPMFEENSFFKDLMSQEDVNVDFFIPQK